MKKYVFFLVCLFILSATACSKGGSMGPSEQGASVEHLYVSDLTSIEDVIGYSTNIVKATLVSIEDFNGAVNVYLFDVDEDYTGNTPGEIHMYDASNDQYIVKHTYYLFLCGSENALYPHTIYTTVVKELIVDTMSVESQAVINQNKLTLRTAEAETVISDAVKEGIVGTKIAEKQIEISTDDNITEISGQADVIAIIRVSEEQKANEYVSTYKVELIDTVKGPDEALAEHLMLPPGLEENTNYYVFLKEDPTNMGTYLLFSRKVPVIVVTEESTNLLALS